LPRPKLLLACAWLFLSGCNDRLDLAPAAPDRPWEIPPALEASSAAASAEAARSTETEAAVMPGHIYTLAELIDLAERRNQATRVAWEQARQAAINVGIAQAAYLPILTASAIGGYQHFAVPFPSNFVPRGFITATTEEFIPQFAISYLLFDFGTRAATVQGARQLSLAANLGFTAAHQRLIFNVAKAYYALDGANAALRAAEQALHDAQVLQHSTEALFGRGLATSVTVQMARRDTAQAVFNLAQAQSAQHDAAYGLLTAMDLPPTTRLRVASASSRPLPEQTTGRVERVLDQALRQRPDLIAAVAKLRATDAGIAEARAAMLPKLSVSANIQGNLGRIGVDNFPYQGIKQPQEGVFLRFDWPLYAGGALQNRLRAAQSQHEAAADALRESRNQALREVALAYDQLDTGLRQYEAAVALRTAAQAAFSSASDAYTHGVGTFTDAVTAETALAAARAELARAHAQSMINAAALALATGALTSAADLRSP
jgi:outer membrane protein